MEQNFTIVEFLTEHTIEVVPSNWVINSNQCWWPSIRGPRLQKLLYDKNSVPDFKNGMVLAAKIIKSFKTYNEAREKLAEAENTSSLETQSESEMIKSRKERKRKRLEDFVPLPSSKIREREMFDDDDDSESSESVSLFDIPPSNVGGQETVCPPSKLNVLSGQPEKSNEKLQGSMENLILAALSKMEKENHRFQEVVLKRLIKIENDVNDLKRLVQPNLQFQVVEPKNLPALPLNSVEEMKLIEDWLSSPENVQILTQHFSLIGGADVKDTTKRILSKIFSHHIALSINWTGKNMKFPLVNCKVTKVIIASVRLAHGGDIILDSKVEDIMKAWFRYSKDRHGGREKRRPIISE